MAQDSSTRPKLIIDCDPGVDDCLAILLALSSASPYDILAYHPQFGNCELDSAYNNILKIHGVLDELAKASPEEAKRFPSFVAKESAYKPTLVRGAKGPVNGKGHLATYFHGKDGLGGISETHPDIATPEPASISHRLSVPSSSKSSASQDILALLSAQPDSSVTYVALGPLTNLSLILQEDEALFKAKVDKIVVMGGALDVPGNTSPVAEFNFYADAHAAKYVISHCSVPSNTPLYLLPLDITSLHALPFDTYAARVDPSFAQIKTPDVPRSPLVHFTTAFLEHTQKVMLRYGRTAMEQHDPLAVYFAMCHPPSPAAGGRKLSLAKGWQVEKREFAVEAEGTITEGMCVVDRRASMASGERGKSRADTRKGDTDSSRTGSNGQRGAGNGTGPAPTQVDEEGQAGLGAEAHGIYVATKTPGSDFFVEELLKNIWGA